MSEISIERGVWDIMGSIARSSLHGQNRFFRQNRISYFSSSMLRFSDQSAGIASDDDH